jgi:nucleotide-binding universal stress UspA family protein
MRVLIAIDSSECSAFALNSVIERSWTKDAEFRIITVVEPAYIQAPFGGSYVEPMIELQIEFEKYCHEMIKEKVAQLKEALPDRQVTGKTLEGIVAASILDEAKAWNADLIIVGSHGRKGVNKFFLGSVAERVACHAQCSVEIVKQKTHPEKSKQADAQEVAAVGGKV